MFGCGYNGSGLILVINSEILLSFFTFGVCPNCTSDQDTSSLLTLNILTGSWAFGILAFLWG
jgi:hypothetical protein